MSTPITKIKGQVKMPLVLQANLNIGQSEEGTSGVDDGLCEMPTTSPARLSQLHGHPPLFGDSRPPCVPYISLLPSCRVKNSMLK